MQMLQTFRQVISEDSQNTFFWQINHIQIHLMCLSLPFQKGAANTEVFMVHYIDLILNGLCTVMHAAISHNWLIQIDKG